MARRATALAQSLPPAPFSFDYISRRRLWFLISAALLVIAVASLLIQGFDLGLDFTSGTQLQLTFAKAVSLDGVRAALHTLGISRYLVVGTAPSGRGALITLPVLTNSGRVALLAGLTKDVGKYALIQQTGVSPTVAQSIVTGGIEAVIAAAILIVIYMMIRFDFKYAITGIAAVFWDALVTMGIISIARVEISEAFIAGVLMIIGYSLNDRIIIFDRVRENMQLRRKGDPLSDLVNRSLNQTLGRSINTAVIVILAMLTILILGGASTRDLAATVAVGVFFGAFSSILLATPLWYAWAARDEQRAAAAEVAAMAARGARKAQAAPQASSGPRPPQGQGQGPQSQSNRPRRGPGGGKRKKSNRPPRPEPKV